MMKPLGARTAGDVAVLLHAWSAGDADAMGQLVPILYGELKQIAHSITWRGAAKPNV